MKDADPPGPSPSALSVEVGIRLRERRQEIGSSLREIADRAAISPGHLSEIENGRSYASLPVLLRLGKVLQYPLAELLPRIGGHRVFEGSLVGAGPDQEELSHPALDLDVVGHRLSASEIHDQKLGERQDALVYVVSGTCELEVDGNPYSLGAGDSADIEFADRFEITAQTDAVVLIIRGTRS